MQASKQEQYQEHCLGLVSFDVTNLFTQVPVDEALKVLEEWVLADDTLTERTSIPVSQLTELIKLFPADNFLSSRTVSI